VRDLFFIEAMRLCVLLCAPEVIFFETLKCHAQYNVLDANNRTRNSESVKLCCPVCRVNDFVLSTSAWRLPQDASLALHTSFMLCIAADAVYETRGRLIQNLQAMCVHRARDPAIGTRTPERPAVAGCHVLWARARRLEYAPTRGAKHT
jgi:hypothetical protein